MHAIKCPRFEGVPTFFRALCYEATRGKTYGYMIVGYEFARHTPSLVACGYANREEFVAQLGLLKAALDAGDVDAIWEWYWDEYPWCMSLVPARRKNTFVKGVQGAYEGENLDLSEVEECVSAGTPDSTIN
jgi:hypothetical protein